MATDAPGNLYLTGAVAGHADFQGTPVDISGDAGTNDPDALIVALDPAGNVQWVKTFGNPGVQRGHRIAVDAEGNSYVAGVSYDQVDFGDGNGFVGDAGGWWSFFLKLDPSGQLLWVRPFGHWVPTVASDQVEYFQIAVALDGKGHVIIGSTFDGEILFGSDPVSPVGDADAFVAALDAADGKAIWHRTFHQPEGGGAPDGNQWITGLTVDPCSGDVFAAGGFTRGIDFDPKGSAKAIRDPDAPDIFPCEARRGQRGADLVSRPTATTGGRTSPR